MKKISAVLALLIIIIVGTFFVLRSKNDTPEPEDEKKERRSRILEPVNQIPVADRPYINITPSRDGKNIFIKVHELKKSAELMEFELEYRTGTQIQLDQSRIDLTDLPVQEKIYLGTCSTGGKCSDWEDVQGGTLLARFTGGDEKYVLKNNWRYFENIENPTDSFTSKDGMFTISSPELEKIPYIIIYDSPGYPSIEGELNFEVKSLVYTSSFNKQLDDSQVEVTIKTKEENVFIYGYDGEKWIKLETQVQDQTAQTQTEIYPLYILGTEQ